MRPGQGLLRPTPLGFATRLPSYYFEPSYYNTPWVGAHPFADYALPDTKKSGKYRMRRAIQYSFGPRRLLNYRRKKPTTLSPEE